MMKRQITPITDKQAAIEVAIRSLTARSQSQQEIHDKLARRNCPETMINAVVQYLTERGYLNDAALADMLFYKFQQSKKYGRANILLKLKQRGLPDHIIEQITQSIDAELEFENALMLVQKKFKLISDFDRAKAYRYLAYRGFSPSIISKVLQSYVD